MLNGRNGDRYDIAGQPFAKGGEGEIYNILNMPGYVIKAYKDAESAREREGKLLAMVSAKPDEAQLKQIAWPLDVVYTNGGHFVGFVMEKLDISDDLNVVYEYGPTSKYATEPWRKKIIIARNLCAVMNSIHEAGHIIGDFNPKNISVNTQTGRITMLDTDSYHIMDGKFRCMVGMPDYLPPEVQKKMKKPGLAEAMLPTFTKESDRFALAIHIFQLLMNGVHPFATASLPGYENLPMLSLSENIMRGNCAFVTRVKGKTVPRFAPPIATLPKRLYRLFKRAFTVGMKKPSARPSIADWYKALEGLEVNLRTCNRIPYHEYHRSQKKCPWCTADQAFAGTIKKSKEKVAKATKERAKKEKRQEEREVTIMTNEGKIKRIKRPRRRMRINRETRELIGFGLLIAGLAIAAFVIMLVT